MAAFLHKAYRLSTYIDDRGLSPHIMTGFRHKLSTQHVMLRLKHQIVDGNEGSSLDTKPVLGSDLTKAFDNITHEVVLEHLNKLEVGSRTFEYIKGILSDRRAQVTIEEVRSDDHEFSSRGTSQGSVLSPLLFKVAMIGLPEILDMHQHVSEVHK